jgi:hypothetical protein
METAVVVALVAATASLVVAISNWFATRTNQRELERIKLDSSIQLEKFKSAVQSRKTLEDARLDYQFEARKRLYNQVEPLIFQLTGLAESARSRIIDLAKTASNGHLGDSDNWLDDPLTIIFCTPPRTA